MSGLGEFCLASSFPEAPCLIFQLGGFLGWLVESKCTLLLCSPSAPRSSNARHSAIEPHGSCVTEKQVEPSVISVLWKDHLRFFSLLFMLFIAYLRTGSSHL